MVGEVEFEEAAAQERKLHRELEREKQNSQKSEQSHVSAIKARGRVGKVAGGMTMMEMETRKKPWAQLTWIATAKKKAIQNGLRG